MAEDADMSETEIKTVLAEAMDAENQRRQMASEAPGLGALMNLPESPSGAAVGKYGVAGPAIGEGLAAVPPAPSQVASYGGPVPTYADGLVGGQDYAPGNVQGAVRAIAARAFARQDAGAAGGVVEVVSPELAPPRRSLLGRLRGRFRRS